MPERDLLDFDAGLANTLREAAKATTAEEIRTRITAKLNELSPPSEPKDDWLSQDRVCGPAIPGYQCVNLLERCMGGNDVAGCAAAWNAIPWGAGVSADSLDYDVASKFAEKFTVGGKTLKANSVDEVVAAFTAAGAGSKLDDSVVNVLRLIKRKISPGSERSAGPVKERKPVVYFARGGMSGGGSRNHAANYSVLSSALKNQYAMVGGAPQNVSAVLRASFEELQAALKVTGKAIEEADKNRIYELIASVGRSEERAARAISYIGALKQGLNDPSISTDVKSRVGNVTTELIEELARKVMESSTSASKKGMSVVNIFDVIAKELPEIRAKLTELQASLAAPRV